MSMMNDTNISTWTVDSSHERSFIAPASFHPPNKSLFSISNSLKTPAKTHTNTHRASTSLHSTINSNELQELDLTNDINIEHTRNADAASTQVTASNTLLSLRKQTSSDEGNSTDHHSNNNGNPNTDASVTSYTETYIHPSDRNKTSMQLIDDAKDEEMVDIISMISATDQPYENDNNLRNSLTSKALVDTMDYTSKLMATIQSMEEDNNLKYKLQKYALKIKKLERQLADERKINENKSIFLDKVNNELNKTNVEIERIECEKRELKLSLTELEDIQQKYRLLEMKNLQLIQTNKIKDLEINKLNGEVFECKNKLQKTLEDRDNISAVSEVLREEITNKRASIHRYKEINKKLNEKINESHKLSETLCTNYSMPDATKLYTKMSDFEDNINVAYNKDLEHKYNNQSRQFMQLKLENKGISEKLNMATNDKNALLNEVQTMKLTHKLEVKHFKKELISKHKDIDRLKTVMWNLNKFIANQSSSNNSNNSNSSNNSNIGHESELSMHLNKERKKNNMNNMHNVTSLSFDHDLDLEIGANLETSIVRKKNKNRRHYSHKSRDLLDDITKVITNQKRSKTKIKNIKNIRKKNNNKNTGQRQFIPNNYNNNNNYSKVSNGSSRSRRIALKKRNNDNNDCISTLKLASV